MQWYRIEDRLPPPSYEDDDISQFVWITDGILIALGQYISSPNDDMESTWRQHNGAFFQSEIVEEDIEIVHVTHWMELPKPPEH